ncbi:MAG: tRNA-intron lyase [Nitrososphaerota archaeon]|jgi:tRNA-intron endonuclease|nr:tRNA-intron lyase [Nitrososphaerota archaeon]
MLKSAASNILLITLSDNIKEEISPLEFQTNGQLTEKGITVTEQSNIDQLASRGYGNIENKILTLTFFEALYLQDKGMIIIKHNTTPVDFQTVLHSYQKIDENAWVNYLIYRDLRSRGYVVREGFGIKTEFRVYERGTYGKDTATYMVLGIQEGNPQNIKLIADIQQQCQNQKKELVIAVMNRRGEIVYYSVSQLTFK